MKKYLNWHLKIEWARNRFSLTPTPPALTPSHIISNTIQVTQPASPIHAKLPKLTIKKFNGDITKWTTFWDSFQSAVHSNTSLSDIDKFSYLNSYLESAATEAISGLMLTTANYKEAVDTLKRRFGNKRLIVTKHMNSLLALPSISSQNDLRRLHRLYDSVEMNIRGLRALLNWLTQQTLEIHWK